MQLQQISAEILSQLIHVSEQLKDEEFSGSLDILSANSIGKHIRHIIEFYDLMMIGQKTGEVNYDKRSHDRVLEENRVMAIEKMNALTKEILGIKEDRNLQMFANYSIEKEAPISLDTTLYRELQYNIEHAVHHMAIVKIAILNEFKYVEVPDGFGIAYSTIKYQRDTACAQ